MVHLTLFSNLTVPSIYSRTEHHCRLPCQTSAKNLSLNSIAICAIMVQTLCQDDVALYVSRCCADIERNRSKKWDFFLQETMPCTHGPSLYVWMSAVVGAVLIAYDYECAKEVSASLFLGSQKQAFLGCGPSLCVCMLVVVVAVLSAYDYDCARIPWASRRFGGEAGLADRESLQLRPCWPNIEPQMVGQKEKKSWAARPRFADQSAAPKTSPQ